MRWLIHAITAVLLVALAVISGSMVTAFMLGLTALTCAAWSMLLFIQQRVEELVEGDHKYLAQNVSALVSTDVPWGGGLR